MIRLLFNKTRSGLVEALSVVSQGQSAQPLDRLRVSGICGARAAAYAS